MSIGFAGTPPEVISGLIYSGPGSSSLVAAASAWNAVAAELASTAQGYSTVILQLAGEEWLGPASAAMAAAAQPYVSWLATTAGQAEQAATQASSAAAAFETVFASVVPPPLIAANRAMLAQAQQSNIFGLNNGVIAQLEAQYAEFWAQNSGAMTSYAGSSTQATNLTTFATAPAIANGSGTSAQAAATNAAASITPGQIQTSLQQILKGITDFSPSEIQQGVTSLSANNPLTEIWFLLTGQTVLPSNLGALVNGYSPFAGFFYNTEGLPYFSVGMGNFGVQIAKSAGVLGGAAPAAAAAVKPPGLGGALGAAGSPVAAGLGNASHVGHLAVPASWSGTTSTPVVRPAVQAISEPITSGESGAGNVLGGMPIGGTGAGRGAGAGPRYGFKPTVMARPMSAG